MKLALALSALMAVSAAPALAKSKNCPPGLAKKTPACVPPGQAKKGVSYEDRRDRDHDRYERDDDDHVRDRDWYDQRRDDYTRIRTGDRVVLNDRVYTVVRADRDRIVLEREGERYRLPRLDDDADYVRVGHAILRVDRKTRAVFEIIELADLILG